MRDPYWALLNPLEGVGVVVGDMAEDVNAAAEDLELEMSVEPLQRFQQSCVYYVRRNLP
jgi:hypothetical protein